MEVEFISGGRNKVFEMKEMNLFSSSSLLSEKQWKLDAELLKASFSDISSNDFNLFQTSMQVDEDCKVVTKSSDKSFICMAVPLRGTVDYHYNKMPHQESATTWEQGFLNVVVSAQKDGYSYVHKKNSFEMLEIIVSPNYFKRMSELYPNLFETPYNRLNNGESFFLSTHNQPITFTQQQLFTDMLSAKNMGNVSQMYIEAKILESLSLFMLNKETPIIPKGRISNADREKMYEVQNIIHTRYRNFPTLSQLALLVGTNEHKLKTAFKAIFNTTVFGYLFDYRMQLASRYLVDTDKTIQEIAELVGYEHQSHFSTAFKRKYGIIPSALRITM